MPNLTVEDVLEHFGIKGMKWGIRNQSREATGTSGREARKRERKDRKIEKRFNNAWEYRNFKAEVHNAAMHSANVRMTMINAKPKYEKAGRDGHLLNDNHPITKQYHKEIQHAYISELNNVLSNADPKSSFSFEAVSGKNVGEFEIVMSKKKITHADETRFRIKFVKDEQGLIVGLEVVDDSITQSFDDVNNFLEHFGVKGMKWGVRRSHAQRVGDAFLERGLAISTPGSRARGAARAKKIASTPVKVSEKGKKLKTSGGKGRPAHADAVRARVHGQVAKKSGVKALSNEELQVYAQRLQLEQNVKRLTYNEMNPGRKFVATLLGQSGKSLASEGVNKGTKEIGKRAVKLATARR